MQDRRRYRKIFVRIWGNVEFQQLSEGERLMALYVLSGPQVNRVGLFRFSCARAAEDLNITPIRARTRLARVVSAFAWEFDATVGCIWIPSWWAFNTVSLKETNFKGALSDLNEVPRTALIHKFCNNLVDIPQPFHPLVTAWRDRLAVREHCNGTVNPLDLDLDLDLEREKKAPDGALTPDGLRTLWNETAEQAGLRRCEALNSERRATVAARLREQPAPDYWRDVLARIARSTFCQGHNDRGWVADFDFLVRRSTHLKVREGKYDDRGRAGPTESKLTAKLRAMAVETGLATHDTDGLSEVSAGVQPARGGLPAARRHG